MADLQERHEFLAGYWSAEHQKPDNVILSDSLPAAVFAMHRIVVTPGQTILDVGVGTGGMARHLHAAGCVVHSMDITPVALEKVAGVTERRWLTTESLPPDTFDLAICHLVAQHVNDEDLTAELENILQSLKPDGMLSIQFASHPAWTIGREQTAEACRDGGVCRMPDHAIQVVERAGGKVVSEIDIRGFPGVKTRWFALHCRKADTK